MIDKILSRQWSIAFFELTATTSELERYQSDAIILIDIFKKFPELLNIIASNWLEFDVKQKMIKLFFSDCLPYMINTFLLLTEKKMFHNVVVILEDFCNLCNSYYGIEYGVVYSVVLLTSLQIELLQNNLSKIFNNKKIKLTNKIDPTLIAGIKVRIKNETFDGSIARQIEQLKINK